MNGRKLGAFVVLALVLVMSFFTLNNTLLKSNASSETNGFNVIDAVWGISTSPQSAAPGDQADTLTVTLQYIYSATAETVETYLNLPSGFSVYNGSSVAYAATTGTFPTGATIQLSYALDLASTLSLGSYVIPMQISWTAAGYAYYLNDTVQVTVQLEGRPQIQVSYASGGSLTAGEVNDVSFIVSNNGSGAASAIYLSVSAQAGGVLNTLPQIQSLSAGQSTAETAEVYVPTSSAGNIFTLAISGSYKDPYGSSETMSQSLNIYVPSSSRAELQISSNVQALAAGQVDTIPVNVTNAGTVALSEISTTLSVQPTSVAILSSLPSIQRLSAQSSMTEELSVYIPSSLQSSALSITFATSFVQQGGAGGSATQSLGFYTTSMQVYNATLSVVPVNNSVVTAQNSKVAFKVENIGDSSVEKPVVTLSVSSPLIVLSNSTFGFSNSIAPGSFTIYEATVTSSPSATLGAYSGTLSILYYDQAGNQHTTQFAVGFLLTGTITLTAESETVTQSARTLSVSGSLLNEGTASAYYASVVACVVQLNTTFRASTTTSTGGTGVATSSTVSGGTSTTFTRTFTSFTGSFSGFPGANGSLGFPGGLGLGIGSATTTTCPATATSAYVGEIDPNSPVAYSATALFTPSNSSSIATLVLVISYQNSFGTSASQPIDKIVTLNSATSGASNPTTTRSSPGHLYVDIAMYGVISAVIASAIAGGVYVRRSRRPVGNVEEKVV